MMAVIEIEDCNQAGIDREGTMNACLPFRQGKQQKLNRRDAAGIQLSFPPHPVKFSIHIFIEQYPPG